MASISVETGLAVATETCGVVRAEAVLGALLVESERRIFKGKKKKLTTFLKNHV